jgi:hypothetical protein
MSAAALMILAAGCGTSTSTATVNSSGPVLPSALAAAISHTLAAKSFEVVTSEQVPGQTATGSGSGAITLIYQAPDRLGMSAGGTNGLDVIRIGDSTYVHLPPPPVGAPLGSEANPIGRPHGWMEQTGSTNNDVDIRDGVFLPLVTLEQSKTVTVTGSPPEYSFRLHAKTAQAMIDASGTIRVANGWVTSLTETATASGVTETIPGGGTSPPVEQGSVQLSYTDFDSATPVNPPPAAEVTVVTGAGTCTGLEPAGGVVQNLRRLCSASSSTTAPSLHLPPPTVTARP